jgi:hypothetical protein
VIVELDNASLATRMQGWVVRVSAATVDEDPDLGSLLDDMTVGMDREAATRFVELAEEAYDAWQDQAKATLAGVLAAAYREAVSAR